MPPPPPNLTMEAPTDSILGHVGGAQIDLGNSFNLTGDAPSPQCPRPPPPPVAGTNRRRPPANTDHPKYNKDYHCYIVGLMSFVDGVQYRMDARFRPSYFLDLTPVDIARYFCLIAYGTAEPDMEHNFPSQARSSHLEFAKKAISWYMPNKLGHWQAQAHPPVGNPTKSVEVNDIIKVVKKKEVRGQGRLSNAKRPFTTDSFVPCYEEGSSSGASESSCVNGFVWRTACGVPSDALLLRLEPPFLATFYIVILLVK
jgi:hypothetical protein